MHIIYLIITYVYNVEKYNIMIFTMAGKHRVPLSSSYALVLFLVKTRSTFGKFIKRINLLKMASLEPPGSFL